MLAVLDWELSTLGDPLADLAYLCLPYHMPRVQSTIPSNTGTYAAAAHLTPAVGSKLSYQSPLIHHVGTDMPASHGVPD